MMQPLFILELRPVRFLLILFMVGGIRGAQHGDAYGVIMVVIGGTLLWPHLAVAAVRSTFGGAVWLWDRLAR